MNTQQPQHAALDAEEREFARVVRALPGGEPPPALDAFILKSAQNAVAAAPGRRRHSWPVLGSVWGISSAAAAVLALGVGWQLFNPMRATYSVPDGIPQVVTDVKETDQGTAVEFIHREPPAAPPPPPSAKLPPPLEQTRAPVASGALSRQLADQPLLKSDSEAFLDEHVAGMAAPVEEGIVAIPEPQLGPRQALTATSQMRRNEATAKASAPIPAPAAPSLAPSALSMAGEVGPERRADADAARSLDSVEVTGSRVRADVDKQRDQHRATDERKRIAGDAALISVAWLERIRERHRGGDRPGAKASLLLYLEKNPEAIKTLPDDLRQLLQE